MAKANERPRIDIPAGLAAIAEDLPRVLKVLNVASPEELGWSQPNPLSLLVPMTGTYQEKSETFLLRLGFQAYRAWPPSAQFVNPTTGAYDPSKDHRYVPQLTSEECRTHLAHGIPGGGTTQLICCSATFEFYDVLHDVKAEHLWRETDNFYTTIMAVRRAMESYYQGPFLANG